MRIITNKGFKIILLEEFVNEKGKDAFNALASQFDCYEDKDDRNICLSLNDFLRKKAWLMSSEGLAVTFLLLNKESSKILGYCTLQTGESFVARFYRKKPQHSRFKSLSHKTDLDKAKSLSNIEVVCLAIQSGYHKQNYGSLLMQYVVEYVDIISHYLGVVVLCISNAAKTAEQFYRSFGFEYGGSKKPSNAPRNMILPVCEIRHGLVNGEYKLVHPVSLNQ